MSIRPLRNMVLVERIREVKSEGGIYIPETFDHKHRPSLKWGAVRDHYWAKVLAIGPQVREIEPGDEVLVWTFSGEGAQFTGSATSESSQLLVAYPEDTILARPGKDRAVPEAPK